MPKAHPPFSENDILEAPSLRRLILEAANMLDIESLFAEEE